ncbi:MAG: GNAT family N-acetyltransferase [Roseiflexaceae bacterium]
MPGNQHQYNTLRPMFEELRGPRVLLRPYTLADAEARHAANNESREHLRPWEPEQAAAFQTLDETRDWILRVSADWLLRKRFSIGIWQIETQRYLGGLGLHPREPDGWSIPAFSIGYWVRVSEQGHGYVTEAVRLLTRYAFDALGAQRVEITCDTRNTRSIRVAERLGFVQEGRLRNVWRYPDGTLADEVVYALNPADRWADS